MQFLYWVKVPPDVSESISSAWRYVERYVISIYAKPCTLYKFATGWCVMAWNYPSNSFD